MERCELEPTRPNALRAIHSESARTITYGLSVVVTGTVPGLKLETRTSNV